MSGALVAPGHAGVDTEGLAGTAVTADAVKPQPKPIGEVRWRDVCAISGRVRSLRVQPWANVASLEAVVVDDTGGLTLVFFGRRSVAGLDLGRRLTAYGRVGEHRGYLAMLNPWFELLP
jgi:RecG-like helicase